MRAQQLHALKTVSVLDVGSEEFYRKEEVISS